MGIPVLASGRVASYALHEAEYLMVNMLKQNEKIAPEIAKTIVRVVVMAPEEYLTDIPENADLKPKQHWDNHARGISSTGRRVVCGCGEENVLDYRGDPYHGESILIHEFAHTVHKQGMVALDPTFDDRLKKAFAQAMDKRKWKGTYAASNYMEYWAEGAQSWFDANLENTSDHNHVNTREEVKAYAPPLAALLEEAFPKFDRSKVEKVIAIQPLPPTKENLAIASPKDTPKVTLRIVNQSRHAYDLEWLGKEAKRMKLGKIPLWADMAVDSNAGHRFLYSLDGKPLGVFEVAKDSCLLRLRPDNVNPGNPSEPENLDKPKTP